MARGRGLSAGLALLCAGAALAADPCQEGRLLSGVTVSAGTEGLTVAAVDEESPAAASGLRAGDRVVQANAVVLADCDAWARAVRDARRERKALLLLVRRSAADVPLVLAQATWERVVAAPSAVPPPAAPETAAPPAAGSSAPASGPSTPAPASPAPVAAPKPRPVEPPSVAAIVSEPPPAAIAPAALVTVEDVISGIEALVPAETSRARIAGYQQQLLRVHRQIETLAAREAAPPRVVTGLRTVVRYFDAAEVAWEADEALREREGRPRHIPSAEAAAAPYFTESDAEATIDEFPFLRATVVREPGTGRLEVSGLWRPVAARTLLWEKGREELGRLAAWVRAGS